MPTDVKYYLGFDFGASSGRAILGALKFDSARFRPKLTLEEIHRFPNEAVYVDGVLVWEIDRLFGEMNTAISKAAARGVKLNSIGIDTWGVDFGILGADGALAFAPASYRDERTAGVMQAAFERMPKADIFEHTGLAFMQFNTLYQLIAMQNDPRTRDLISDKNTLLFMPDLFAWYLTGEVGTEYTIASTSQMIDPRTRTWSRPILQAFDIPEALFAPIEQPGKIRGYLKRGICPAIDYDVPVVAVASHDTASAVAAVPAKRVERFAYLSSGTWSLLGIEADTPICTPEVMRKNFTNEGGLNGTSRVLKNIMGLWIIQECRKQFNDERVAEGLPELSFADIVSEVESLNARPSHIIDVDDDIFFAPGLMADRVALSAGERISGAARVGQIADIVYKSLAVKYKWGMDALEEITHDELDCLYIVGGGGNNELLNKYTACALQKPVYIGPAEGTVIGNLLVQALGAGDIHDIWELRQIVADSFGVKEYIGDASEAQAWAEAYDKLKRLLTRA